ncbi:hypothetical protein BX070DRAFT_33677 [Coemansia spiralis]|nr:hypothetical protein BX070DRAFT_33677 [Coemansia spiralis]
MRIVCPRERKLSLGSILLCFLFSLFSLSLLVVIAVVVVLLAVSGQWRLHWHCCICNRFVASTRIVLADMAQRNACSQHILCSLLCCQQMPCLFGISVLQNVVSVKQIRIETNFELYSNSLAAKTLLCSALLAFSYFSILFILFFKHLAIPSCFRSFSVSCSCQFQLTFVILFCDHL